MSRCEWIVCERSSRWAAALRTALDRQGPISDCLPRLREVRSLVELSERLPSQPKSFGMVEVRHANLDSVLDWLADALRVYSEARFAALLDTDPTDPMQTASGPSRQGVADALLEAGAVATTDSPRRLRHILQIAHRHWELMAVSAVQPRGDRALVDWARTLLPWQEP